MEDSERFSEEIGVPTAKESDRPREISEPPTTKESLMEGLERSEEIGGMTLKDESLIEESEINKEISRPSTINENSIKESESSEEIGGPLNKNERVGKDLEKDMEIDEPHSNDQNSGKLKKNAENEGPPPKKSRRKKLQKDHDSSKTDAERRRERDRQRAERERAAFDNLKKTTEELTGSKPQTRAETLEMTGDLLLQKTLKEKAKEESGMEEIKDQSRGSEGIHLENKDELLRHLKKEKITIHHARGILIGCAEAGKTTLLKRLLGQTQDEVEDIEPTRGLEVHQHLFHIRNGHLEVIGDDNTQTAFLRVQASDLKQSPKEEVEYSDKSKSEEAKDEKATLEDTSEENSKLEDINLEDMKEDMSELGDTKEDTSELGDTKEDTSELGDPKEDTSELGDTKEDTSELEGIKEEKSKSSITMKDKHVLKILNEKKNFPTVSILDFAGQLAYYACHQIYITPKAFFILVLNLTQGFEDAVSAEKDNQEGSIFSVWKYKDYLKFWINSIKTFGSTRAPIFVIATHTEDKSEEEIDDYMEKFWELVPDEDRDWFFESLDDRDYTLGLMELDEKSKEKLQCIKNSIVKVVSEKINTKIEVRSSWALLEQLISDEGKKVLSLEEISEINKSLPPEYQLQSRAEISEFLKCFHDNGLCLYFEDERSREHVIWDTQWFANAFSKLIADKNHINQDCKRKDIKEWKPFNKTGALKEKLVDALWKDESSYGKYKSEIVSYMERLLMIVAISSAGASTSESEMSWYIPCMNKRVFEKAIFEKEWEYSSVLCFRFTSFAMFVFYRLIAYCMGSLKWRVSSDEEGSKALYQTAGVFDYKNHTVVVCINDDDIQVQVMRIKPSHIEAEVSQNVGEFVESALHKLTKTFNEQKVFEKGYRCQKVICNEENGSFIPAGELSQNMAEVAQCPSCPIDLKHDINVPKIMGFWEKRLHSQKRLEDSTDSECPQSKKRLREDSMDSERKRNSHYGMAYPFSKRGPQVDVMTSRIKADVSKSVGLIYVSGKEGIVRGTGFRVGSKYIMTCLHVIEDIVKDDCSIDAENAQIVFGMVDPRYIDEKSRFHFEATLCQNKEFDLAILELKPEFGKSFPPQLILSRSLDLSSEVHLIGHPGGVEMKEDSGVYVHEIQPDNHADQYIRYLSQWSKDTLPRKIDYYEVLREKPRKILFHTTFDFGSSGGPGIMIQNYKPYVVLMVRGCVPICLYEKNVEKYVQDVHDKRIEYGYAMEDIFKEMAQSTNENIKEIAAEIFTAAD